MLGKQRVGPFKDGISYDPFIAFSRAKFVKSFYERPRRNYYTKSSNQNHKNIHVHKTHNYYSKKGHIVYNCYTRKLIESANKV